MAVSTCSDHDAGSRIAPSSCSRSRLSWAARRAGDRSGALFAVVFAVEEAAGEYVRLFRRLGIDPAQGALAFVTSRAFVTSNIIGATTLAQLHC
jgi:aryl-alcohol dehydrogenase-like predicted oxidoreductase